MLEPSAIAPERTRNTSDSLRLLAAGRLGLAVAALTVPQHFARLVGIAPSPELTYMTRIYGARALAMGLAYLTSEPPERHRWHRLGLAVDIADTATGLVHLVRRDVSRRAAVSMCTGSTSRSLCTCPAETIRVLPDCLVIGLVPA